MIRHISLTLGLLFVLFCAALPVRAAVIDFETDPAGGAPVDDAFLSTPYNISGGGTVRFYFDANGNNAYDAGTDGRPVFEAYGADSQEGFVNSLTGIPDTANGGLAGQLGNFFLRQLQPGTIPPPFIAEYTTSQVISGLSGEIWDIDGGPSNTEQWQVDVLDSANNLLASQLSPLGSSMALDGLPWTFAFTGLPAGVEKLRITFVGSKTQGLGLAFNNFNPTAAPEPSGIALVAMGLLSVGALARRHRLKIAS